MKSIELKDDYKRLNLWLDYRRNSGDLSVSISAYADTSDSFGIFMHEAKMTKYQIDKLCDGVMALLEGSAADPLAFSFENGLITFIFHVDGEESYCQIDLMENMKGNISFYIDSKQMEYFSYYLQLLSGRKNRKDRLFMEKMRNISIPSGFRWCVVGNVIDEHLQGEEKTVVHGTKHFSPGTKVYMAPTQWGDGYENIVVIGKQRNSFQYIQLVMPSKYICNWRLGKVYRPNILNMMETSEYRWWDDTEGDKEAIMNLVTSHKKVTMENIAE